METTKQWTSMTRERQPSTSGRSARCRDLDTNNRGDAYGCGPQDSPPPGSTRCRLQGRGASTSPPRSIRVDRGGPRRFVPSKPSTRVGGRRCRGPHRTRTSSASICSAIPATLSQLYGVVRESLLNLVIPRIPASTATRSPRVAVRPLHLAYARRGRIRRPYGILSVSAEPAPQSIGLSPPPE